MGQTSSKTTQDVVATAGAQGTAGVQGIKGIKGEKGDPGDANTSPGPIGPQGPQGPVGLDGPNGLVGIKGLRGDQGPQGPRGDMGATGNTGLVGVRGGIGSEGPQGPTGSAGDIGPQGPKGVVGDNGDFSFNGFKIITPFCADGNMCAFPSGVRTWSFGPNSSKIWDTSKSFNIESDNNIRIGNTLYLNQANANQNAGLVVGKTNRDNVTGLTIVNSDNSLTHFDSNADNGLNFIRHNTNIDTGGIRANYGQGPYSVKMYKKDLCVDSGQFDGVNTGASKCMAGNNYQRFYYSYPTGVLRDVQKNQCLDASSNAWRFADCDPQNVDQHFWKYENQLKSRNGDCLDVGNANRHASCNGDNENQLLIFN